MQDLSSLQHSLIRSADSVTRLLRDQGPAQPLLGMLPIHTGPTDVGTDMTLRCASLLTTQCVAAPARYGRFEPALASR